MREEMMNRDGGPWRRGRIKPAADGIGYREQARLHEEQGRGSRELLADGRELEPGSGPAGLAGLMVGETGVRVDFAPITPQHHEGAWEGRVFWIGHADGIRPTSGRAA